MKTKTLLGLAVLAVVAGLVFASVGAAGTDVVVGKRWPAGKRVSMDRIDHAPYDRLLKQFVDDEGWVDYRGWHKSPQAVKSLDDYLAHLSRASLQAKASRPAKLAFWINAYNALTLKGILREYPTDSIRDHTPVIPLKYNIWKDLLLVVDDKQLSLDQIEHSILRKMNEPRIHFAIVCAAQSCPRLLNEAYTAQRLEEQLVKNSRQFFAQKNRFRADIPGRTLYLSPILDWFADDFGKNKSQRLKAIATYLPTPEAQNLARSGNVQLEYLDYNWQLNDQARRRR